MNPRAHSILWPVLLCEVPLDGIMLCGKTIFHFWIHCRETDSPLYFFHSSLSSFSLFFDAVISPCCVCQSIHSPFLCFSLLRWSKRPCANNWFDLQQKKGMKLFLSAAQENSVKNTNIFLSKTNCSTRTRSHTHAHTLTLAFQTLYDWQTSFRVSEPLHSLTKV